MDWALQGLLVTPWFVSDEREIMYRMAKESGAVLVIDERVGETFTPRGNDIEEILYGFRGS